LPHIIKKIFILAGLSNILGVLICSKFLTNQTMMEAQPSVMGFFGLLSIILWGIAYITVCKNYATVRFLIALFALEKLIYVIAWINFHTTQSLKSVIEQDLLAGIFYSIYGINDFIFMLFFIYVAMTIKK